MMTNRKQNLHYLSLTFFISLAIILRFWNLELKPLWMDEVITAIFSLGKNYSSIPLDVVFPLEKLRDVFSYQPGVTCSQIAQNIATESTHPPLFFCGMYAFLGWVAPLGDDWVNKLRSPSAWFGVAVVVAVYFLNRLAFSRKAGLMGAAFVAVSPFAVYLSQEARHYTLPMLTISLSLLALIQIQQDIFQRQQVKVRVWLWLTWTIINIISIYIHYFCIIAFIAQIATLLLLIFLPSLSRNKKIKLFSLQKRSFHSNKSLRNCLIALILSISAVAIALIPWLRIVQNHLNRSETSWLPTPQHIEPFYQTLISWVVMVVMLPIEGQPLAIIIISGLLMLLFSAWLGWKVFRGTKLLLKEPKTCLPTLTLLSFTTFVLLGILTISYILGKDITVAPRYNFIYYPSFSALIAASLIRENSRDKNILLSEDKNILLSGDKNILLSGDKNILLSGDKNILLSEENSSEQDARTTNLRGNSSEQDARTTNLKNSNIFNLKIKNHQLPIILFVGLIGCIFVVSNQGLQKPYLPQQVAQKMYQEPNVPVMAVMAYSNYQDVALGLSYALALERETVNYNYQLLSQQAINPNKSDFSSEKDVNSNKSDFFSQQDVNLNKIDFASQQDVKSNKSDFASQQDVNLNKINFSSEQDVNPNKINFSSQQDVNPNKSDFSSEQDARTTFAFLNQISGFESVFEKLSQLPNQNISQLNLWILAPGRLRRDYPEQIKVSQSLSCNIDINQHYRIGIPYQLYRCRKLI